MHALPHRADRVVTAEGHYRFEGRESAYARFRPRWPESFARIALERTGVAAGARALVVSMGAGTGADAEPILSCGCEALLVEPNAELLAEAERRFAAIPGDRVRFAQAYADGAAASGSAVSWPQGRADLIVVAQALHTFKDAFSGAGFEERARQAWRLLLKDDGRPRLSIWYYNPDPRWPGTRTVHDILLRECPGYAASGTPLFQAAYFRAANFLPWMEAEQMWLSPLLPVSTVELSRADIPAWLSAYSFGPTDPAELERVSALLQEQWFDRYAGDGRLRMNYVGMIVQAPLRRTPPKDTDTAPRTAFEDVR